MPAPFPSIIAESPVVGRVCDLEEEMPLSRRRASNSLPKAVWLQMHDQVQKLLDDGGDPHHSTSSGQLIHIAVEHNSDASLHVTQALLTAGADADAVDDDGLTPLRLACNASCVRALLAAGADGEAALDAAVQEGAWDSAQLLCSGGIRSASAMRAAVEAEQLDIVEMLLADAPGADDANMMGRALALAKARGRWSAAAKLLRAGVTTDASSVGLDDLGDDEFALILEKVGVFGLLPVALTCRRMLEAARAACKCMRSRHFCFDAALRTSLFEMTRSLSLFEWARAHAGMPFPDRVKTDKLCQYAARHGQIGILRFGLSQGCPWESIRLTHFSTDVLSTVEQGVAGGDLATVQWCINNGAPWGAKPARAAAQNGDLNMLRWILENYAPSRYELMQADVIDLSGTFLGADACEAAAGNGHLETLKWLVEHGAPLGESCAAAAEGLHIECLKWAHQAGGRLTSDTSFHIAMEEDWETLKWLLIEDCPTDERLWLQALTSRRDLDTLMLLHEHNVPFHIKTAAGVVCCFDEDNRLDALKWLRSVGCPWDGYTMLVAVGTGDLELMKWIHNEDSFFWQDYCLSREGRADFEESCMFHDEDSRFWAAHHVADYAIDNASVEIFDWCIDHGGHWFRYRACAAAAIVCHRRMLEHLRMRGCPWGVTWNLALGNSALEPLSKDSKGNPHAPGIEADHVASSYAEMLLYVITAGCNLTPRFLINAAGGGDTDIIATLFDADCPVSLAVCAHARSLNVLQALREHGAPWCESTCVKAASTGHLACLTWAVEAGCPCGPSTFAAAAKHGNLHVLKWLRERGIEWDSRTTESACSSGEQHVLKWLLEHGCPINVSRCTSALYANLSESNQFEVARDAYDYCKGTKHAKLKKLSWWLREHRKDLELLSEPTYKPGGFETIGLQATIHSIIRDHPPLTHGTVHVCEIYHHLRLQERWQPSEDEPMAALEMKVDYILDQMRQHDIVFKDDDDSGWQLVGAHDENDDENGALTVEDDNEEEEDDEQEEEEEQQKEIDNEEQGNDGLDEIDGAREGTMKEGGSDTDVCGMGEEDGTDSDEEHVTRSY